MPAYGQALALDPKIRAGIARSLAAFGRKTRDRGVRYARSGRVRKLGLRGGAVVATVVGSRSYEVVWTPDEFSGDGLAAWASECTCPVGLNCKHGFAVAAVLLGHAGALPLASASVHDGEDRATQGARASLDPVGRMRSSPTRAGAAEARRVAVLDSALELVRDGRHAWDRQHAATLLLQAAGFAYDETYSILAEADLKEDDPDLRCWHLARAVAKVRTERVPAPLAIYLERGELERRFVERGQAALRRELVDWAGRARVAKPRSLRLVLGLRRWPDGSLGLVVEVSMSSARGEKRARTAAALRQLRNDLRNDPGLLPSRHAALLFWLGDRLDALSGSIGFGTELTLPAAELELCLERASRASLVFWSEELDAQLAVRAGIAPGAPVALGTTGVHLVPDCARDAEETVLRLRLLWDDGRSRALDEVVYATGSDGWRSRSAAFVISRGEVSRVVSQPPAALVDRFLSVGGVPLTAAERVPLLLGLATRWPHLRATLAARTHLVPVEPVVTLDLRDDDWLQIRLRTRASERDDAAPERAFEWGADESWSVIENMALHDGNPSARVEAVATAERGKQKGVGHASLPVLAAIADDRDTNAGESPGADQPSSGGRSIDEVTRRERSGESPPVAPADAWLEAPDPERVAPAIEWLGATGAGRGDRRGPGLSEPPWPDRAVGFWLRLTARRAESFFDVWQRRPRAATYLGNGRARRLLAPTVRAMPRVRIAGSGVDFLSVSAAWETEAEELTTAEIAALRSARTRFVRLRGGWVRRPDTASDGDTAIERALADLGVEVGAGAQRLTLWQLAGARQESLAALEGIGADGETLIAVRELRERIASFRGLPRVALPRTLRGKLRPYQQDGVDFLAFASELGTGAILADDMGLGKTIQALAWLEHLRKRQPAGGPALVVCPASVVHNWQREAARFVPKMRVLVLERGSGRHAQRAEIAHHDLVITNYALLRLDATVWADTDLRAAILDEAQNVKNPDASVTRAALGLRARHRVALTGTPLENRPLDLWSIMSFVCPGYLGSRARFSEQFDRPDLPAHRRHLLAARLRPVLLRRLKRDVAHDLPDRLEERRDCELTTGQRRLYLAELAKSRRLVDHLEREPDGLRRNRIAVLAALTRLRQVCCHPALAGGRHDLGSGKFDALFELLEPLLAEGHKVLLFSQFVTCLKLIARELRARGIGHHMLTGETVAREAVVRDFVEDPRPAVFLLSLKAGGTGLNLTAASYVILFDPWWNPAVEAQAIDRSHRIGQDRTVIAYRLLARGTIEEKIAALQERKASLVRDLLGEDGVGRALSRADLQFLLADPAE